MQSCLDIQLGTLLYTKGSTPQIAGAFVVLDKEKVILGTLGGGLLESHAQKNATLASFNKQNTLQLVNFDADMEDETGAICGGSALYSIDTNPNKHLNIFLELIKSLRQNRSGTLITYFEKQTNENIEIEKYWVEHPKVLPENILNILNSTRIDLPKIIESRKSKWIKSALNTVNNAEVYLFIEPIFPKSQLLIVGAGHIGQALAKFASLADFEITVLDNREEMTKPPRFPEDLQVICKPLNDGFKFLTISSNTYIVITTQGHRTDIEALRCCIQSDAAYIGVIGSKRKAALMGKKLVNEAWATQEEWDFIHTPIGIDIHSKTVNEIAISITSELIKERYELHFLGKRKKVSSLILAAGKSTRMGQQKLLMTYQNSTIINTIVEKSLRSNVCKTIVVVGSHKDQIKEALINYNVCLIENENFENGMLSSVQAGVSVIDKNSDGILVLLGDQPMVSEKIINRLITSFQKTSKGLIIPTFNRKRGHPVLIHSKYKEKITMLNSAIGLRELFINNNHDILEVEVNTISILNDIDTPEDYIRENIYTNTLN
jgi:CTP:molybdopterin cytidylyltransferase MocA/xanthine/CO dehydrogenase XdhC/CoxF family maturation factor